jgi:hypothetical protein
VTTFDSEHAELVRRTLEEAAQRPPEVNAAIKRVNETCFVQKRPNWDEAERAKLGLSPEAYADRIIARSRYMRSNAKFQACLAASFCGLGVWMLTVAITGSEPFSIALGAIGAGLTWMTKWPS